MRTSRNFGTTLSLAILVLLTAPLPASANFDWDIENTGAVNDLSILNGYHTFVTNTSAEPDTVTVNMVKSIPTGWVASLCEGLLCYPPFLLDIELILDPDETLELIIDITALGDEGTGSTQISLASKNNPAATASAIFTLVSSGVDVLLVSDVNESANESLIVDSINASGKTHGIWRPFNMGKASAVELANFPTVVWASSFNLTTLDAEDMANLTTYVSGGGNLLLSGQNLAYANCDPSSPFYDVNAVAWFQSTLGTAYVGNLGSTDFVTSQVSDPMFSGSSFNINGGDGSDDNASPDIVTNTGLGLVSLNYSGGGGAMIRSGLGSGYTTFASFGIEGIDSASDRSAFMTSVLDWFANPVSAVGDEVLPLFTRQPEVWPNPFNPQTNIKFEVGGERAASAEVTVYDLQGRAVRQLYAGEVNPGPQNVIWNGRDDSGRALATGVYLARVTVAGTEKLVKMTLVK